MGGLCCVITYRAKTGPSPLGTARVIVNLQRQPCMHAGTSCQCRSRQTQDLTPTHAFNPHSATAVRAAQSNGIFCLPVAAQA